MNSPVRDATVAYLAPEGFVEPITAALGDSVVAVRERLVLASAPDEVTISRQSSESSDDESDTFHGYEREHRHQRA